MEHSKNMKPIPPARSQCGLAPQAINHNKQSTSCTGKLEDAGCAGRMQIYSSACHLLSPFQVRNSSRYLQSCQWIRRHPTEDSRATPCVTDDEAVAHADTRMGAGRRGSGYDLPEAQTLEHNVACRKGDAILRKPYGVLAQGHHTPAVCGVSK